MHGAGCVRPLFRTAEPLRERRYENWITHTLRVEHLPGVFQLTEEQPRRPIRESHVYFDAIGIAWLDFVIYVNAT